MINKIKKCMLVAFVLNLFIIGLVMGLNSTRVYANSTSEEVLAPTFDVEKSEFCASMQVSLSCATTGATIYYNIGSSVTSSNAIEYTGPITINETTTIYALAKLGDDLSAEVSKTYTLLTTVKFMNFPFVFPTTTDDAWSNENGKLLYVNIPAHALYAGSATLYIDVDLNLQDNSYVAETSSAKFEFVMNGANVKEVIVSNYASNPETNGTYVPKQNMAKIDDVEYNTLQDAVNAVETNGTIVLLSDNNEIITVSKNLNFILDTSSFEFSGEINGEDDYHVYFDEDKSAYYVSNYMIKVQASEGGTVTGSEKEWYAVDSMFILDGNKVKLNLSSNKAGDFTAVPNEGYDFDKWTYTLDESTYEIGTSGKQIAGHNINGDITLTAVFKVHVHTIKTSNGGQLATCETAGYKPYYECECGTFFADEALTQEIGDENALTAWLAEDGYLAPTGHHFAGEVTYTWNEDQCIATWYCDHEGCTEKEFETVTGKYVKDSDATEEENEKGHYEATFENPNFVKQQTATNSVEIPDTMLPDKGLGVGAIVGITVGSIVVVSLITFAVMFVVWKKKQVALKFLVGSFKWIDKTIFKK